MSATLSPVVQTQGPNSKIERTRWTWSPSSTEPREVLASIVLPAYNEERALPIVLADLANVLDERYEILVVDDGSTDNTVNEAKAYPCRIIEHERNQGKGRAVRTGIDHARGHYIIIMDADATYPAEAVPRVVELLANNDLVRCIRQNGAASMPLVNRIGNRIFDFLLSRIHGLDGSDHLSGLYGLHREILINMDLEAEGFDLEVEIGIKARSRGLKTATMPISYYERLGEKKLHAWRDGWHILTKVLFMLLTYNPSLTFVAPGLTVILLALIGAMVLRNKGLITPYFGLGIHSFIVAALGMLAGFQLVVFGIAAKLYGIETGCKPDRWLVRLSSVRVRLGAAGLGFLLALAGVVWIATMGAGWLANGAGAFEQTRELIMAATVCVGGLQLLSAALFISIFAERIQRQIARDNAVENRSQARVMAEA